MKKILGWGKKYLGVIKKYFWFWIWWVWYVLFGYFAYSEDFTVKPDSQYYDFLTVLSNITPVVKGITFIALFICIFLMSYRALRKIMVEDQRAKNLKK